MKLTIFVGFLFVVGCTTTPKFDPGPAPAKRPSIYKQENPYESIETALSIDYDGLKSFLKLNRAYDQLGYSERSFNTCNVGYGYSSTHNCETKYFVVSHFQLKCRDSEGTVSEIIQEHHLRPISQRQIAWSLRGTDSTLVTDSEGYGQIAIVAAKSMRSERLKISTGNDFLYMKAGDLKRMITPRGWCNP